jgi:hypothetical protein
MVCRPQLPDSHRLYHEFAEKRGDMQNGADLWGTWEKASSQIECPHRDCTWRPNSVSRSCGNPNGEIRRSQPEALTCRDFHNTPCCVNELVTAVSVFRNVMSGRIFQDIHRQGWKSKRPTWDRILVKPCVA